MHNTIKLALAALLLAVTTLAFPAGADAATKTVRYNHVDELKFAPLGICARVTTSGTFSYDYTRKRRTEQYKNIKLNNPKITVVTYQLRNGQCLRNNRTVGKVEMRQRWSGYSCGFDPAIGVSFPWGVSVEGFYGCSREDVASRKSTYSSNAWLYEQSNSGAPVRFGNVSQHRRYSGPCFGYGVDLRVWNAAENRSDANDTVKHKVCLP
ncbi:MAG: hypothetical protein AAF547_15580 [Actinomycetota bacterium]